MFIEMPEDKPVVLTTKEHQILWALANQPVSDMEAHAYPLDIENATGVSRKAIGGLLASLRKKGCVAEGSRMKDKASPYRYQMLWWITEKGKQIAQRPDPEPHRDREYRGMMMHPGADGSEVDEPPVLELKEPDMKPWPAEVRRF